ncbi:ABC transporter permease [Saccharopolyspora sp. NFXS83]|uniref:ABC transporter permease n=1 Tax=Saccharopolyspora sp. NFXS83 TaxID=2993560 RepID=UPI00224A535F|nr:ABC transporter permease [Saccharopolyspora sp. NFXS83]MCX2732062.1 ABC transporter permease [Saccharopolyspora sp. NFXS83]
MSATAGIAVPGGPGAVLTEVAAVAGRRLRHLRRAPGRFIGITLNPLVSILVLGYLFQSSITIPGGGDYQEYLFAGAALQVGLAGVGPTAIAVASDRQGGLIDRFRSLPISRASVLFGHTCADFLVGLVGLVVVTAVGLLLGWRPHTGPLQVLAGFGLLAVFLYVMLWVGVLLGMVLHSLESIDSLAPLIAVVFPFLSNAFLSEQNLPGWLVPVAAWNPISAVATACRQLWGNPVTTGTGFPSEHPGIVVLVTLAVLFAVTTWISLRRYRDTAAG